MGRNPTGRIPSEQGKPAPPAKPILGFAPLSWYHVFLVCFLDSNFET